MIILLRIVFPKMSHYLTEFASSLARDGRRARELGWSVRVFGQVH